MNKTKYATYRKHHVCADVHFNHKNIALYCPETRGKFVGIVGTNTDGTPIYVHNIDAMNEEIIAKWNSVVQPDDHTFILGDVAMGLIEKAPALIQRLNGDKTLIVGNHDRKLVNLDCLYELFIDVRDYACFHIPDIGGVVMSHYPFASWDGKSQGAVHFYGHLHGAPTTVTGRAKDVGIDTNNLYPYVLEELMIQLQSIPLPLFDHHLRSVG